LALVYQAKVVNKVSNYRKAHTDVKIMLPDTFFYIDVSYILCWK